MTTELMTQEAPFPTILEELIKNMTYKEGWEFFLWNRNRGQGSKGLTLCIQVACEDTDDIRGTIHVNHYMIVPAASYNERSWKKWLFEQILLVEQHEAAEFFKINGERAYKPFHEDGYDPYLLRDRTWGEEA